MTELPFGPIYHKIQGVYKRDKKGIILPGEYSKPEFKLLENVLWIWTEKVDGTNIRIHWNGAEVTINGKTDNAQLPGDLYTHLLQWTKDPYTPEFWKNRFNELSDTADVTIYGEGYGAGIQKVGGNYRKDKAFIVFDIKVGNYWLERDNVEDIAASFGMEIVPVVMKDTLDYVIYDIRNMANPDARMEGSSWLDIPGNTATIEGYVGHPEIELFNKFGERVITKIKIKDWTDYYARQS